MPKCKHPLNQEAHYQPSATARPRPSFLQRRHNPRTAAPDGAFDIRHPHLAQHVHQHGNPASALGELFPVPRLHRFPRSRQYLEVRADPFRLPQICREMSY